MSASATLGSTKTCDVLVIGSGAGGLATAITAAKSGLDVLLVEKTRYFGGTSALSGGGVWMPMNRWMREAGHSDSVEQAKLYLRSLIGDGYDEAKADAFLQSGPAALDFIAEHADLQVFCVPGAPDYEPHLPGAVGSRTLINMDFDGRKLGPLLQRMRPALPQMGAPLGMQVSFLDIEPLTNAHRSFAAMRTALRLYTRHLVDLLRFGRATRLTNGNALTARLLKGAADAGVTLWSEAPAVELLVQDGGVQGAVVKQAGNPVKIHANRGVVLASGGFGANESLRKAHLPLGDVMLSLQPEGCQGDGIKMATAAGAVLAEGNVSNAIWTPMSAEPQPRGKDLAPFPHLMLDRLMPGSIIVDRSGRRFANEAASYQSLGNEINKHQVRSAWLISDARAVARYGLGLARPAPMPNGHLQRSGYLHKAKSIAALAVKLGLDAVTLEKTVAEFNEPASRGEDPKFDRGKGAYSTYNGDHTHLPNGNLAALEQAPFYAVELRPGMLCSLLGVITDAEARVLDNQRRPIDGLYAVGIDSNSPWCGHYPGAGASLGPAITFGYIAARSLAARAPNTVAQ